MTCVTITKAQHNLKKSVCLLSSLSLYTVLDIIQEMFADKVIELLKEAERNHDTIDQFNVSCLIYRFSVLLTRLTSINALENYKFAFLLSCILLALEL